MRTDETIKTDVVDQLYWDSRIDASDVTVKVDAGRVELSGTVPTHTAKRAAEDDARLVAGVNIVDNNLDVETPTAMTLPTDEDIRANVQRSLVWNRDLSSYDIDVSVQNGWVTLEGTVDAYWERIAAENEISDIKGVIGVTNKLAVVPTRNVTDESIAKDVVDALDRNMNVDVDDINVTVENGTVYLTGTISSRAAKIAAYNSAKYTFGVTDVENNLVVKSMTSPTPA